MVNAAPTLLDAANHLHETMDLQEAAFMAAGAVNCPKQKNAVTTIIDHVSSRLAELEHMLATIRKERRAMAPDISKLDHQQLLALWEAVRAARDLLDMFNCQPRFRDHRANDPRGVVTWTGAGDIVDDLALELGQITRAVSERSRALPAVTKDDRKARLELLIKDEIGVFECTIEEAEQAFHLIDSEREGEAA